MEGREWKRKVPRFKLMSEFPNNTMGEVRKLRWVRGLKSGRSMST